MILDSIIKAYDDMLRKNYNKIYWAIDLHGTCLKSTYDSTEFELINEYVIPTLKLIQARPESVLVMWSSGYTEDLARAIMFFIDHKVYFKYINMNPEVFNTRTGCFEKKFYFSIGIDDKFGFNPSTDWQHIYNYLLYYDNN